MNGTEPPNATNSSQTLVKIMMAMGFVALAFFAWIAWNLAPILWSVLTWRDPSAPASVSQTLLVKTGAPCTGTLDAEVYVEHDILTSSDRSSAQEILNLTMRSGGVILYPGEHLLVIGTGEGSTEHVRVTSALENGKECWIDSDLLSRIATKPH